MIKKKKIDKFVSQYFKSFSSKNLSELDKMFSKNIVLIDWNVNIKGKKKVLDMIKQFFKNKKIKVNLKRIFYNIKQRAVSCKINLKINNKKLDIIDIIHFDKRMKITKIEAYLG